MESPIQNQDKDNTVITIFGKKGSGKSFLTEQIIQEFARVSVIDNMWSYNRLEVVEGFENCVFRIQQAARQASFRVAYRTQSIEDDSKLVRLLQTIPNQLIVIEEANRYVSSAFLPDAFEDLIRLGRHKNLDQIYLARRPSELHRDITANSDIIVSFLQQEPRDIEYLRHFMGDNAFHAMKLHGERKHQFIVWGEKSKAPSILIARYNSQRNSDAPLAER